jgi:multidrug resistance efflux pump
MQHKRPPVRMVVPLALILLVGGYYGWRALSSSENGALKASGTIEAVDVNISPELSGKVKQVLVDEGQAVKLGDPLFRLDDTLLRQQRDAAAAVLQASKSAALTAQAAYASAQAQYQVTLDAARAQDRSARTQDWSTLQQDNFDQPNWYFTKNEQIAAAQKVVDTAGENLNAAQDNLDEVVHDLDNAEFLQAEERLANARLMYLVEKQVNAQASVSGNVSPDQLDVGPFPPVVPGYRTRIQIAKTLPNNQELADAGQDAYDAASQELQDAQQAYNDLLTTDAAQRVLEARAAVSVAQESYDVAQDRLTGLQTGENAPQVTAAAAAVQQAQNGAQQAEDAIQQAQANLNLLEAQLEKLEVTAPMDGVILTRNVEVGEFVQPGATAFSMANINELTITVYVPEDRYGEISLGQKATMTVDSFPGQTFSADVSYISDQAEFTPRNVQTVEGRSSTVYAIKLKVADPEGKLKPGMPADVTFIK